MQVFVAEPCGFCYGVKRAVDMARGECGKDCLLYTSPSPRD